MNIHICTGQRLAIAGLHNLNWFLQLFYNNAGLRRLPKETVVLSLEDAKKVMRIIETFEDDDVQNVFHNLELSDELLEDM